MKHKLCCCLLFVFFAGIDTKYNNLIQKALDSSDELTCKLVKFKFTNGNYRLVPHLFFISIDTFYYKINKFIFKLANNL